MCRPSVADQSLIVIVVAHYEETAAAAAAAAVRRFDNYHYSTTAGKVSYHCILLALLQCIKLFIIISVYLFSSIVAAAAVRFVSYSVMTLTVTNSHFS